MDSPADHIPELAVILREMALAETSRTEKLAAITLGLGKLVGRIRDGVIDEAAAVDGIINSAHATGLVDDVGLEPVEAAIGAALEPLAARVNGGGGWDPASELWEDKAGAPTDPPAEPAGLDVIDAGEDDWNVPPREWLLGNMFCREFISSLLADGGTGKTALRYPQYISLAIGRSLTGEHVFQRSRVLVISLEDSINELRRRMKAACLHHGVPQAELTGWLFYAAIGAASGKLMVTDAKGRAVVGPLAASLERIIIDKRIDLVALDPFVKTHSVEENHNSAIDGVVQILTDLAIVHSIAVDTPHHTSKGAPRPRQRQPRARRFRNERRRQARLHLIINDGRRGKGAGRIRSRAPRSDQVG